MKLQIPSRTTWIILAVGIVVTIWIALSASVFFLYGVAALFAIALLWHTVVKKEKIGVADLLAALSIVVVIIIALAGKNTSGPEETLIEYLAAVDQGDSGTIVNLQAREANNPLSNTTNSALGKRACPSPKVQDEQDVKNTAHIQVLCGGHWVDKYTLIRENNEWKVRNVNWPDQ